MEKRLKCYVGAWALLIMTNQAKGGIENWFFWFTAIMSLIMLWFSIKSKK